MDGRAAGAALEVPCRDQRAYASVRGHQLHDGLLVGPRGTVSYSRLPVARWSRAVDEIAGAAGLDGPAGGGFRSTLHACLWLVSARLVQRRTAEAEGRSTGAEGE